jgi:dolichol-phosphate mannosyltransferase
MRVVVAMPVYNEARGIGEFVEEIATAMTAIETVFVVADDCSTDDTLQVLAGLSESHRVVALPGTRNMGHGPTTLRALRNALTHQPDVIVAVDGDGQFRGPDIRRLVEVLGTENLDIVEGVRVQRNDPLFRRTTSWATRTLVQLRTGERPDDANTPLRVYRPAVLEVLLDSVPADAITPNLIVSALTRVSKLRVGEERVTSIPRRGGDPAGTSWRARRRSVPSKRFIRFCLEAGRQWVGPTGKPVMSEPANTMEKCLQCGSGDFTSILREVTSVYSRSVPWAVVECTQCALLQTSPRPTSDLLDQIYSSSYSYVAHDAVEREKTRRARGLLDALDFEIDGKEVLDIGCGSGALLREAQARGARVSGCEVSPGAVAKANAHLGRQAVTCANAEDYLRECSALPEICILSHSLEHFLDPKAVLARIRDLLPPEGRLVVVVPNVDGAPRGRLRKYWGYWQVPVHVVHFSERTLKRMLEHAGFDPRDTKHRNADFLSIGLAASNILGLDVQQASPKGPLTSTATRLGSRAWSHLYRWGAQDLIVVSSPAVASAMSDDAV